MQFENHLPFGSPLYMMKSKLVGNAKKKGKV